MESPQENQVTYTVHIFTGNEWFAGTNANIHFTLYGSAGKSEEQEIENKGSTTFEKGLTDTYTFDGPYLGTLSKIRIGHDNANDWFLAIWYLNKVTVEDPKKNETVEFPCYQWLATSIGDGKIERELKAIVGPNPQKRPPIRPQIPSQTKEIIEEMKRQMEKEKERMEEEKKEMEEEKKRMEKEMRRQMEEEKKRMEKEMRRQMEEEKKRMEEEMKRQMVEEWIRLKYGIHSGDIDKLLSLESEAPKNWSEIKKTKDAEVWRRNTTNRNNPPITKTFLHLEGVPYEKAVRYITDWEQRKRWDNTFSVIEILEEKKDWNLNVIYCSFKMPLFSDKREMILACLECDVEQDCHVQAMCSTHHQSKPPWVVPSHTIRAESLISGIIIRPVNDGTQSSKVTVITQVDLRGSPPQCIKNSFLEENPVKWMQMLKAFCAKHKDEADPPPSPIARRNKWKARPLKYSSVEITAE